MIWDAQYNSFQEGDSSPKELTPCLKLKFSSLITVQPDGSNLWYFKLRLFDQTEFIVWYIQGLWHGVAYRYRD